MLTYDVIFYVILFIFFMLFAWAWKEYIPDKYVTLSILFGFRCEEIYILSAYRRSDPDVLLRACIFFIATTFIVLLLRNLFLFHHKNSIESRIGYVFISLCYGSIANIFLVFSLFPLTVFDNLFFILFQIQVIFSIIMTFIAIAHALLCLVKGNNSLRIAQRKNEIIQKSASSRLYGGGFI